MMSSARNSTVWNICKILSKSVDLYHLLMSLYVEKLIVKELCLKYSQRWSISTKNPVR